MLRFKTASSLVLAGALMVSVAACEQQQQQQRPTGPVPVTTVTAEAVDLPVSRTFIGKVISYDNVNINPRVQGILQKRVYEEGAMVKEGALLYVIEKDQYKMAVQQAEANLANAKANALNAKLQLERSAALIETGDVSQSVYDTKKATYDMAAAAVKSAKAALDSAKLDLEYTEIKAPFTGRVGMTKYDVGQYITPSSGALVNLVSVDPMGVVFSIGVKDIMAMLISVKGNVPEITAELYLSGVLYPKKGKIDFIDNVIDQTTDTLKLRAKFPNPKGALIDGEIVNIKVTTDTTFPMLVVPQAALQQDQAGRFVMVVKEGNVADMRRVITGMEKGKNIVITEGLEAGDQVVVEGLQKIRQGTSVAPSSKTLAEFTEAADAADAAEQNADATAALEAGSDAESAE